MPSCKRCGAPIYRDPDRKTERGKWVPVDTVGNVDYQQKIDRRTENDYKHQAYINSVKEASEKALKESQNLPLPKVYTQIPDLPLKRVDSEVISTIVEHSEEEIRGAVIDEQIWRSQLMNPAEAGFSFTKYLEGTPRNEIYPSSGDYWKCLNCKARGDRWYMLDHVCIGSVRRTRNFYILIPATT